MVVVRNRAAGATQGSEELVAAAGEGLKEKEEGLCS